MWEGADFRNHVQAKYKDEILRQPVALRLFDASARTLLRQDDDGCGPVEHGRGHLYLAREATLGYARCLSNLGYDNPKILVADTVSDRS